MSRQPSAARGPRSRLLILLVTLAAVAGAAGCGIPSDDVPRVIDDRALVDELRPDVPQAPTRVAVQFDPQAFEIYLIGDDGKLTSVSRDLSVNASAQDVIEELIQGPVEGEEDLSTSLPSDLSIIGVESQAGTVVLNVATDPLANRSTAEQRLAIAQLVFTVAELDAVTSFRLQVNGVNESLPTDGDNSNADEPVRVEDFKSVDRTVSG